MNKQHPTHGGRPSWLTSPCPPWCHGRHLDDDHPDDRYHESLQTSVPVMVRRRSPDDELDGTSAFLPEPSELVVVALQPIADTSHIWVALVGERQFIEVSAESAHRLYSALGELLGKLR